MPRRGNTNDRGYGAEHQKLRRRLLPYAYGTPCWRCGEPMLAGQELDLGHSDDRTHYTGFEHARCNRKAGSAKAHGKGNAKQQVINVDLDDV